MKLRLKLLPLTGLAILTYGSNANAQPLAFTYTSPPTGFRNNTWAIGQLFTVGGSNITVVSLGAYDQNNDGFVTQSGIPVGIFRQSDSVLLASTTVVSGDPLVSDFRFHPIAPLTLLAGQQYDVVAVNESDLYSDLPISYATNSLITDNGYAYGQSATLQDLNTFTGTGVLFMANFQIGPSTSSNGTPEPGSLAMFVITGITGSACLIRRRRASIE